ncbi:MAG: hypothetical protein OXE03_09965 [Gammaproteobacteria bacterium]|nr:hypothetical protein [Gammaproteobacteria bacterium]
MDKQTIHLITLIVAIVGSNAWSHGSLSARIAALETRVDNIDKRLVIVETSLKANNQYIASFLDQQLQRPDALGAQ